MNLERTSPECSWNRPHVAQEPVRRGASRGPFRRADPVLPRPRWPFRKPRVPGVRRAALRGLLLSSPPRPRPPPSPLGPTAPRPPEQRRPRARRGQEMEREAERARRSAGVAPEASIPARTWAAAVLTGHGSAGKHHGYLRPGLWAPRGAGQSGASGGGDLSPDAPPLALPLPWAFWLGSKLSSFCCCQVASVLSDSVRPYRRPPTRLLCPWDSPGKSTGVGCHFLLQCMKVKSKSEVAQSCETQQPHGLQPTRLLHPWYFPGRSTGVGCHCLLRVFFQAHLK